MPSADDLDLSANRLAAVADEIRGLLEPVVRSHDARVVIGGRLGSTLDTLIEDGVRRSAAVSDELHDLAAGWHAHADRLRSDVADVGSAD